ncbi:UNVERIFIED_CONTAM: hypothetical protein LK11_29995 [Mumia flava]
MQDQPEGAWFPLTSAQQGLYFAQLLAPGSPAYITAEVVEVAEGLDVARLTDALARTYADHEQLRVRVRVGPDGPQQQVLRPGPVVVPVHDVTDEADARSRVGAAIRRPMDLEAGEVTRTAVLRFGDGRCWWLHAAHHLVVDGFGFVQLARRVAAYYRGATPDPVTAGVADLVTDDAALAEVREADRRHWEERTADATGPSNVAGQVAEVADRALRVTLDLPDAVQQALLTQARGLGARWTEVVVGALAAYLARLVEPGTTAVRVGLPLMNRAAAGERPPARARTVCTATNVLPVTAPTDVRVGDLVGVIAAEIADAGAHACYRQEDLARTLRRRGVPAPFGPQVNLVPFAPVLDLGDARGRIRNVTAGPVEDMTWCLRGVLGRGPVALEIDANPRLYDRASTEAHAHRIAAWLGRFAAAAPETRIVDLPLLPPQEHHLVVETFNDTAHPVAPRTLAEAFDEAVGAGPDAVALVWRGRTLTYAELSAEADRVADAIEQAGAAHPGAVVGVALERSPALFAAVHGVVRSGAAFCPLEPGLPPARIAAMVEDAGISVVVTSDGSDGALPSGVHRIDIAGPPYAEEPRSVERRGRPPGRRAGPDDPAYVLFTSGSTGRPKGVVVSHRAIDNRLAWMQHHLPLAPGDRVLHKTPISFDVSVWELFWPLQVRAGVVVAEPGAHRDPRALADVVVRERVDVLHFVPSMLRVLLADRRARERLQGARVRHVVCSGEALTPDLVEGAATVFGTAPVNLYGPTEAAVDVTVHDTDPRRDRTLVPIGRPVWNTRAYVLDPAGRPLGIGMAGELCLAGVQLADGYAGRPDATAAAFVRHPLAGGSRLYRTGDRARWRHDGTLEYLGRLDDQVKIAGQRIELGEVEQVLGAVAEVDDVAVVVVPRAAGADELVACYVPTRPADVVAAGGPPPAGTTSDDHATSDERAVRALTRAARASLTDAMRPSRYVPLAAVPTTASGKTDRRALASTAARAPVPRPTAVPQDRTTEEVCRAAGRLLETSVGPDDDLFALGTTSLLALRLLGEIEDVTGATLRLSDLFENPRPSALARLVTATPDRARGTDRRHDLARMITLRPGRSGPPLIALPPAGGLGWCYTSLLRHLPPDLPVHALQAPGLDGAQDEEGGWPESLTSWARLMLSDIRSRAGDGPLHLVGWSVGGMAAHEVARLALASGGEVGAVVLLDAYPSDQWQHLGAPTETEALRGVLRIAGLEERADESLDRARTVEILREGASALAALPPQTLEASIRSVHACAAMVRNARHEVLHHDLVHVTAAAPREEHWLSAKAWERYVDGTVDVRRLEATHPDLVREPHVARVGAIVTEEIERWS